MKNRSVIKIESVAFGGSGVGRADNLVVFVPFSAPGDELEIEITQRKKNFLRGRIRNIIKPSPWRTDPVCRYYGICGGCCYQHIHYAYQLAIKKKQVEDAFRRIGKVDAPPVLETVASPRMYHYRGKARYHVEDDPQTGRIGFLDISGGKIVDIEHCAIMQETINEQLSILRENRQNLWHKDELTIWSRYPDVTSEDQTSVVRIVQGKRILAPYDGFFQANEYLTDRLVDEVCRLVRPGKAENAIDAFCGSGLFSLFLSPFAEDITGIEMDKESVKYAKINAANLNARNVRFLDGNVEIVLREKFLSWGSKIDLIVLDPPRVGCEMTLLKALMDLQPSNIIYISCNPATQARDIKYLCEGGYHLQSLHPLDMFPQTEHIEVIGYLKRIMAL